MKKEVFDRIWRWSKNIPGSRKVQGKHISHGALIRKHWGPPVKTAGNSEIILVDFTFE